MDEQESADFTKDFLGILDLFWTLQQTKELPRQGLILAGFKRHEVDTVAGHSYIVAILSYLIASVLKQRYKFVDTAEILKMAIFHDIGEALTGDVGRYVKWQAKEAWDKVEENAVKELSTSATFLSDSEGKSIIEIVEAYNERRFPSGWVVKVADSLDAAAQSHSSVWARKGAPAGLTRNDKKLIDTLKAEAEKRSGDDAQLLLDLCTFFEEACCLIREEKLSRIIL